MQVQIRIIEVSDKRGSDNRGSTVVRISKRYWIHKSTLGAHISLGKLVVLLKLNAKLQTIAILGHIMHEYGIQYMTYCLSETTFPRLAVFEKCSRNTAVSCYNPHPIDVVTPLLQISLHNCHTVFL